MRNLKRIVIPKDYKYSLGIDVSEKMNAQDLRNLSEAYTQLSAKKDDSYLETDVKKRQKNNEKARKDMEKMGTSMKNPHFEEVRGQDTEMRKAASADRKAGDKKLPPSEGKANADKMQRSIKFYDKLTKKEELEQIDEISQKTATRAFAKRATDEYETDSDSKKSDAAKSRIVKKFGKKAGDHAERAAHRNTFGRSNMPSMSKEELELDENRRAARAAGGYKDDSKKQNDPSKAGFTGIGNMSIDQIRKMSARMDKEKTQKEEIKIDESHKNPKSVKGIAKELDKAVEMHKSQANRLRKSGVSEEKEGLDPVGKEDGDVNNDGKKNSTDKYLMKRRAAIGKAMGKKNIRGNDSAEQKARLEKKRGMKLDDHPQFKKEESDYNYVEAYLGELHKGRHGQSEKDYQDSRSNAGKMISGDSKGSGANYSYKAKNTGSNPAGGSKKPQGQARMSTNDRAYLAYQKANLKKEAFAFSEVELEELNEFAQVIDQMTDEQLVDFMEEIILETAEDQNDLIEICEHLEGVELLSEVSDSYYDSATNASKASAKANRPSRMDRMKSAAKAAGSRVKAGVKKVGKKVVQTAGKVAGEFSAAKEKQKAKAMARSDSSSSDSDSDSESTTTTTTTTSAPAKKKRPSLLGRAARAVGRGLKKAVGKTARAVSGGSDKLAKRLGEDYDQIAHLYESGKFTINEIENIFEKMEYERDMDHPKTTRETKAGDPNQITTYKNPKRSSTIKDKKSPKKMYPGKYQDSGGVVLGRKVRVKEELEAIGLFTSEEIEKIIEIMGE